MLRAQNTASYSVSETWTVRAEAPADQEELDNLDSYPQLRTQTRGGRWDKQAEGLQGDDRLGYRASYGLCWDRNQEAMRWAEEIKRSGSEWVLAHGVSQVMS